MASDELRSAAQSVAKAIKKVRKPPQSQVPWVTEDPAFAEGINVWMHTDGGLRFYDATGAVYEVTKTAGGTTTSSTGFPADPEPALFVQTYVAQWARTFCNLHGVETGAGLWYGDDPMGAHAGRRIMIGLPDATIRTDTAGATIDNVELFMINLDAYQIPVAVHFGLHAQTSAPATFSAVWRDGAVLNFPSTEWQTVHPVLFGEMLRDDQARGLTIEQPPGFVNAGQIDWATVAIRISYTK